MSRVDDKARYYLEQAVPQLREFEANEIFSQDEIRTLVRKRTDFERLILSPGSKPADFLAYIDWELSLEKLRAKRCARLHLKLSSSGHASAARIFQTFDRSVLRHPGSSVLWRRYLAYADQTKATKRWRRIMTRALRLLPSDGALWVMAGQRAVESGDMDAARGFFMRGCRFCTDDALVWIEYARAEMGWLARLTKKHGMGASGAVREAAPAEPVYDATRVATLAADQQHLREHDGREDEDVYTEGDGILFNEEDSDAKSDDGDFSAMIHLPKAANDLAGKAKKTKDLLVLNDATVKKMAASPALDGAITRAIVDAAQKQPFFGPEAAEAFFDLFALFANSVPAQPRIAAHVQAILDECFPTSPSTWNCRVKKHLLGTSPEAAAFPRALREALATLREGMEKTDDKVDFAAKSMAWIDALLQQEDLDIGLQAVLEDTKRKLQRA